MVAKCTGRVSARDGMQLTATLDWVRDRTIFISFVCTEAMKAVLHYEKEKNNFFFMFERLQ